MRRPTEFADAQAERIIRALCIGFGLSRAQMRGPARNRAIAWPRQLAMYLVRAMEGMSLPQIGRAFGGRHHTTVMAGCRETWRRFEADDPGMLQLLVELAERLEPRLSDIGERRERELKEVRDGKA